jgi:hypothetical protein
LVCLQEPTPSLSLVQINWQPEQLDFSIDGVFVRSVKKSDTVDANGVPEYPSTPSRIQLSIWPAGTFSLIVWAARHHFQSQPVLTLLIINVPLGINTSAPGTIQWAGGLINWNDPDYTADGDHFAAVFETVLVQCSTPTNSSFPGGGRSFVYSGLNAQGIPQAYISNATTLIGAASSRVSIPSAAKVCWFSGIATVGVALGMTIFA